MQPKEDKVEFLELISNSVVDNLLSFLKIVIHG